MHHKSNTILVCGEKTLGLFSRLLAVCDEPEWAVTNEKFVKVLEYMLWDAFKKGVSMHLAECSKCVFIDLDIMLALLSKALGSVKYESQLTVRESIILFKIYYYRTF